MTVFEPIVRRWTREEYYRMGDAGLFEGQRVELIEGEIVQMAPQKDVHAIAIELAARSLSKVFGSQFWIRQQLPLRIRTISEPEPDVSVVVGDPRDYLGKDHPDAALLLIEVSDTTLAFDRGRKASLYASGGFADYWIVNLIQRRVEIYRDPVADPAAPSGFRYGTIALHEPGETIAPLSTPSAKIAVSDLLP